MKKILALVSLLFVASACSPLPTNQEAVPDKSANLATETKPSASLSEAEVIAKEKAAWEAIKNKDYDAFGSMLASDQMEVGSRGVYDKAGTLNSVKGFEPTELTFSDWKVSQIDKDAVVVTYRVNIKGRADGKEMPPASIRASSAWVNRDGKWLAIYHQDCEVKTAPPPAANPPAKTAASPASTPAQTVTGPDPVVNEKAIWEMLKSKNYEGFAGLLASNAIEVEPDGVYDKAGSVKGVSQFDFSKAELSDWKSLNFDSDAALVTYVVKMPGPDPAERHSTIWVKRDSKWVALFHHGTPVEKAPAAAKTKAPSK